jgi:protein-L-isoaspartate(D-aspartate) O-methyltransferase
MFRAVGIALFMLGVGQLSGAAHAAPSEPDARRPERLQMVSRQIESRGVRDPRVLEAMRAVPRHRFVPESEQPYAYQDRPLPIGHGQTISQPYIVALMSELADVKAGDTVLEVGTGSGYQAAVLAEMGAKVYSIEILEALARRSKATLEELGYSKKVEVRHGDGYAGWPEHAPFDAIVVTAAPPKIPEPLKEQLKVGGRLVIPVGKYLQSLLQLTRTEKGFREESVIPVRFVPMTGKAQE